LIKRILSLNIIFILMFIIAACNKEQTATNQQQEDKLTVYTTIYPLQYFTERIGGDYVSTENVVPPGADAHSVEITTKTMMKIANSSAFIHTGTGLESFAESVEEALKKEDVLIVNATKSVDLIASKGNSHEHEEQDEHNEENHSDDAHDEHSEENHSDEGNDEHSEENHSDEEQDEHNEENHSDDAHEDHSSNKDPHIWLDPNRSIKLAENIKNALIELKPDQKEEFENNFSSLKNELIELDTEFKTMVAQSKTKTFIVSHLGLWVLGICLRFGTNRH
jgi:zinc transport system substrate-binding protein